MSTTIAAGNPAPGFTAPTNDGGSLCLEDLRGKAVVLYFYPRDDTPGCTREAQEFTEALDEFASAGAEIVGVSKDTAAKHDKFRAKYGLPFTLVSDAENDICERYGVWVEKKNYGKTYMGIERATFLIDPDGTVAKVWRKVKVAGHVEKVLEAVKALNDAGG
jgi:peroxiredoxin Q/BCP